MCIYRKAFVFKPTGNQLNILAGCNLSFTKYQTLFTLKWLGNLT